MKHLLVVGLVAAGAVELAKALAARLQLHCKLLPNDIGLQTAAERVPDYTWLKYYQDINGVRQREVETQLALWKLQQPTVIVGSQLAVCLPLLKRHVTLLCPADSAAAAKRLRKQELQDIREKRTPKKQPKQAVSVKVFNDELEVAHRIASYDIYEYDGIISEFLVEALRQRVAYSDTRRLLVS